MRNLWRAVVLCLALLSACEGATFHGCNWSKAPMSSMRALSARRSRAKNTKPPAIVASSTLLPRSVGSNNDSDGSSQLAEIRTLFFMFYACLGSVMPYLPIYYRSLGLQGHAIGVLGAIPPAVAFVVSPLWGAWADETGRYQQIMLYAFLGSVMARLATVSWPDYRWLVATVLVTAALNAPVKPLMDSAVMNALPDKSDYGKQRLFGQLGFGVASSLVGPLLTSSKFSKLGYKTAFLAHALLAVPTAVMMSKFVPKKVVQETPNFVEGFRHLAKKADVVVFFGVVFLAGLSSGIIENFAYVRLAEIGGEGTVMGVSRLLSSLAGAPTFWLSGKLTKRIGVMGVLQWTLLCYVFRFVLYATVRNPWHALPAEVLRGAMFGLFWAAATYYTHEVSPAGLRATMLSILNGVYGGLGQSLGSLIGGALQNRVGTSKAFLTAGLADAVLLALFVAYRNWPVVALNSSKTPPTCSDSQKN